MFTKLFAAALANFFFNSNHFGGKKVDPNDLTVYDQFDIMNTLIT